MNVEGPVVLYSLQRPAEVLRHLVVDKLHLPCRAQGSHKPGNVVYDLPHRQFANAQCLLTPLSVLDVDVVSEPSGDVAALIAQGVGVNQEPPISSIVPAH